MPGGDPCVALYFLTATMFATNSKANEANQGDFICSRGAKQADSLRFADPQRNIFDNRFLGEALGKALDFDFNHGLALL
jgi:hypothetical protein